MASDTDELIDMDSYSGDVDRVVSELAALSRAEISLEKLAAESLDHAIRLLAAVGGSVWIADKEGQLQLLKQIEHESLDAEADELRHRVRNNVFKSGTVQVASMPLKGYIDAAGSSHELILFVSPIRKDGDVAGLFELIQRPRMSGDAIRGNLRFLKMVCQAVSDYLDRRELRTLRNAQARNQQLTAFTQKVQQTLDLKTLAYELTNESRQLIGCDRVSLAMRRRNGFRLLSISGIDTIDRRSNTVCRLEDLIAAVANTGEPFWYLGDERDLPPQILHPLESYLSDSHVRGGGIVPMMMPDSASGKRVPVFAALIFEQFNGVADDDLRDTGLAVAEIGKPALLNALRYQSLPTLPFARNRDDLVWRAMRRSRAIWGLLAAASLLLVLCCWPAEFAVRARGELQPENRREAFAPMDGQVMRVAVQHGDRVKSGATLLELNSPQLDVEIQRLHGEYDTTRKRLSIVESSLLQVGAAKERSNDRVAQLSAEQEELTKLRESQQAQLALLTKERKTLVVRSPMDGEILTWDVEQLLTDRPVERGQALLSVGALSGQWIAEVQVPDDQISFLLDSQSAVGQPLAASFQLATDRSGEYSGTVRNMAVRTELNADHRPVVKATIDFDETNVREMRPGATIFARIHCGHKPLGYVWFHELIEMFRGWKFYWVG